jgi:hypothetical protein
MKTNANSNVLRSEIENEFDTGAASNDSNVATLPPAIIHCRDAADEATLTETFDLSKVAGATKIVHGLANATQLALLNSASKGTKVITTGMPLDVAAQLGDVGGPHHGTGQQVSRSQRGAGCHQRPQGDRPRGLRPAEAERGLRRRLRAR